MQNPRTITLKRIQKAKQHLMASIAERKNAKTTGRQYRPRIFLHKERISENIIRKVMNRWEERAKEKGEKKVIYSHDQVIYRKNKEKYKSRTVNEAQELIKRQLINHATKKGINEKALPTLSQILTSTGRTIPGTNIPITPPKAPTLIKLINQVGLEKTKNLFKEFGEIGLQIMKESRKATKSDSFLNAASTGQHFYIYSIMQYLTKEQIAKDALEEIRKRAKDAKIIMQSGIENKEHYAKKIWAEIQEALKELEKYNKTFNTSQ